MPWCEMCQDYHLKLRDCLRGEMRLSKREKEVMGLIAEARSNKSIAEKLSISIHTVRTYLKSLYIAFDIDGNKYDKRLKLALLGQELEEVKNERIAYR